MAQNSDKESIVVLGKASFIDFDAFLAWCNSEDADNFFTTENLWTGCLYDLQGKIPGVNTSKLLDAAKVNRYWKGETSRENREQYYISPLIKRQEYINAFSTAETPLQYDLLYEHEKFDIISFGEWQGLIPCGRLKKTHLKDYSATPIGILRSKAAESLGLTPGADALPDSIIPLEGGNMSVETHRGMMVTHQETINAVEKEIDDVENARVGQLAEMQAEIDRMKAALKEKQDAMMEKLNAKKEALLEMKRQMEQQLFLLETEIYSIRCFIGEVTEFIRLRTGKSADVNSPITLFQKFRFLDEEMGKAISLYDFDFNDVKLFEQLLQRDDNAFELFCPNDKCVSLVRVSKTGTVYGYSDTPYGAMLNEYVVYHGGKIGILIRNGENLYLGWTDEEHISLKDDMFYTPGEEKNIEVEDEKKVETTTLKQAVSRYFVFTILQGVLAEGKMLALPRGVKAKFSQPSKYIIYSAADRWLADNRYGTFRDLIDKVNEVITVGDDILSITYASDGYSETGSPWYRRYSRDRNDSHRTHDTYFENNQIYKINLIEDDDYGDKVYYVSLPKSWGDSDYVYRGGEYVPRQRESRANFAIRTYEFINLTYMNSVWLQYVITTRNLGYFGYRDKMNSFAEVIRYLNKALQFVREREKTEKALIEAYRPNLSDDPEWPVKLSEWKLANRVRTINDYQAKRFAKTL